MEIIWKARALRDREEIHAYLARTSPSHAHAVISAIQHAINHLEYYPRLGKQAIDRPNDRLLIVPRTSYTVVYRLVARGQHPRIEITRIHDQRRQRH